MIKMKLILIAIYFFTTVLYAQKNIEFEFDYARYNYDSSSSNIELYYSIGQKNLTRVEENGDTIIKAILSVKITDKETQKNFVNKKYGVNTKIDTQDSVKNKENMIGVISYLLPVGKYYFELTVRDGVDTTLYKYLNEEVEIFSYVTEAMTLSDIEFASRIIPQSPNTSSIFYKNTLEVIPNPLNVYGMNMPMLFYYAELYNLSTDTSKSDVYLNSQVLNSYGIKVFEKSKSISRSNNSIVDVGVVNTSKYPNGSYTLFLNLIYADQNFGVSSQKKFFVVNPHIKDTLMAHKGNMSVTTSEFAVMSVEDCDNLFNGIKYIAASKEISQYENLSTLDAKREFLFNFFGARDPNPGSSVNEFKEEFLKRIETVESRYKTFTRKGVRTDRGRVYLTLGEPDEIELHPNDYNSKPYEVWYFNSVEGGIYFIFGDISGYSDYELLHSTKRGELRDENWQRRILAN
jgi:GWxTD domain-containing protein